MVGRKILQYQLEEKLGAGGMGEVYKALDTRLNRFVAIKVLSTGASADPEFRRRFIHEAQAASALNHPNIITIYDVVDDGDTQCMVIEYVTGKSLLELIPGDGLPVAEAIQYAAQMADALGAAHSAGIIHRDLKPANVMVNSRGLVKLLDFGLAKLIDFSPGEYTGDTTMAHNPLTVAGAIMGTANYMSPEQAEGRKLDGRSDIFSFGTVLYEMVTGRRAFRGDSALSTLSAVLRDDIQPIGELTAGVPLELEQIVVRCLKKDPTQRFQSMQEVSAALGALRQVLDSGLLYSPPTERTIVPATISGPRGPSKAVLTGIALFLLGAAIVGGYWWTNRPQSEPPNATTQASPDGSLTNRNIIDMVAAKVAPSVIVGQIRASKTNFDLSAAEVIRLSKAGVPSDVIEVMRNPNAAPSPAPTTTPVILSDGLAIRLNLAEDIPSDAKPGDAIQLKAASNLRVADAVVVSKGAAATGVIVDGAKKKLLLLGGKMTFRLESIDAIDGQKMPIRATAVPGRDGASKRAVSSGPKPKGVAATAGTDYVGYIDGSQTVMVKQ